MKRELETPYWIGDVVWVVSRGHVHADRCDKCGTLPIRWGLSVQRVEINLVVVRNGWPPTYSGLGGEEYSEQELFTTKAEAQAECARRNKETEE